MNTTQCNKIDALLNFDIPKKDQQPRAHLLNEYPFTFIDRKRLLAALNAMDSDVIKIRMVGESPLLITGVMDHDVMVESVIAPRIYPDEAGVEYYE